MNPSETELKLYIYISRNMTIFPNLKLCTNFMNVRNFILNLYFLFYSYFSSRPNLYIYHFYWKQEFLTTQSSSENILSKSEHQKIKLESYLQLSQSKY